MVKIATMLIVFILTILSAAIEAKDSTLIPLGSAPRVDGIIQPDEWNDCNTAFIGIEEGWLVKVLFKRDSANFYFCFMNLKHNNKELYPEILMDVKSDRSSEWEEDDWWFHASYQDCEAMGSYNIWDCSPAKEGWSANNFPLDSASVIEIQISFDKINFQPDTDKSIGIAFNVTDTRQAYYFWPVNAKMESPDTWQLMTF
jgi:hypothetical protein